ncbi:MAG: DUF4007 domain-containing protein [Oleiphilus sp.]|nr:MAG: DUF4007 domain-containing protein [Oleiphilus sp.]
MKAKFSGHETFPLRYGWLQKATYFVASGGILQTSDEEKTRKAVVELGIGKNMVNSIRYWAEAVGAIASHQNNENGLRQTVSEEASLLFGDKNTAGLDEFLESPGAIWLIHFWLNFDDRTLTSYRYFFNYSNVQLFDKQHLINMCLSDAKDMIEEDSLNDQTVKKDIDCFLNTYVGKKSKSAKAFNEDLFTSPLSELGLIQEDSNGHFSSPFGDRDSLPKEIFIYGLLKFAQIEFQDSNASSIDFESLLSKPLSPGRIFRLSERGLAKKLDETQEFSDGKVKWIDSLGLRQIQIDNDYRAKTVDMLKNYFGKH